MAGGGGVCGLLTAAVIIRDHPLTTDNWYWPGKGCAGPCHHKVDCTHWYTQDQIMGSLLSHSGHAKNQAKQLLCYEMLVLETTLHESMRSRRHVMVMVMASPCLPPRCPDTEWWWAWLRSNFPILCLFFTAAAAGASLSYVWPGGPRPGSRGARTQFGSAALTTNIWYKLQPLVRTSSSTRFINWLKGLALNDRYNPLKKGYWTEGITRQWVWVEASILNW